VAEFSTAVDFIVDVSSISLILIST
jgi:hypothetical protein